MNRKNFKETGKLEDCLRLTAHHANWGAFQFAPGEEPHTHGKQRVESIENGLLKAMAQVRKIQELATRTNNTELLAILDEQFSFGLDENGRR